ncbi:MAG: sulfate adenylyltransferase subunit CysN [Lentisphaeria bacterium]|jgi:bifunctional enzyme CysN/CysC|nr:sulfate adenylyltransferase subunit CysN [Lentisphaeria bacterium]
MDVHELLRQNERADLLRFSTAGSVDDGKSTLIGRLLQDCKCIYDDQLAAVHRDSKRLNREEVDLALLTDGLKAEREQGITIDVAYRYFSTPRRRFIVADTPGHEQYTRNMATGASTADLAVVLVDARHGVLVQSRRHAFIAALLGIPHLLVAVNKMDLVGYSRQVFEDICADFRDFAAKLGIHDIAFIPMSALRGDNVVERADAAMPWYEGATFLHHLENLEIAGDRNLVDFRFPVQYVNRPTSDFRGFCGTVASGVVRVGDEVVALPSGRRSRVKSIVTLDGEAEYAFPPQSVTLCLEDELDISRGDLLAHAGNLPKVRSALQAMLVWMDDAPLRVGGEPYLLKHCARTVRATVRELAFAVNPRDLHREAKPTLELNEIGRVSLDLLAPIPCDPYDRNRTTGAFILIDPATNRTVAAGTVIEREAQAEPAAAPLSRNITREGSLVDPATRRAAFGHGPATVWLTGLSGSGKSTIAKELERQLIELAVKAYVLDGDNIRHGLNRDLGFAPEHRAENIRRIAEVASLMNEAGLVVLTAFISPYEADRNQARAIVGPDRFLEIHLDTPLATCEARDPKGLYARARAGEIEGFTGISAPYEPPRQPALRLDTSGQTPGETVAAILELLRERGIIPRG